MADELRSKRGKTKSIVNKRIMSVQKFKSLDQKEKVKEEMEQLIEAFEEFEIAHESFHNTLQTEEEWDESDCFFHIVHGKFIATIDSTKKWLNEQSEGDQHSNDSNTGKPMCMPG